MLYGFKDSLKGTKRLGVIEDSKAIWNVQLHRRLT